MLGSDRSPGAIINVLPSLPIHSSVLVALIAGLFLAVLIVRAQRLPSEPSAAPMVQRFSDSVTRTAYRRAQARLRRRWTRAERRARMTVTTTRDDARVAELPGTEHAERAGRRSSEATARGSGGFRIRWGRTFVTLIGALALFTAAVTGVLAALTPLLVAVPLTAGGVLVLSLLTLRSMAVVRRRRRRRRRVDAAMRAAMNPVEIVEEHGPGVPSTAGAAQGPAAAPDGEDVGRPAAAAPSSAEAQQPETRQSAQQTSGPEPAQIDGPQVDEAQVDEDGLPVDLAATFGTAGRNSDSGAETTSAEPTGTTEPAATDHRTADSGAASAQQWQPREVPKPQYLEADKAERTQPEPLIPEEPKPSREFTLRENLPQETASPAEPSQPQAPTHSEDEDLPATGTEGAAPPSSAAETAGGAQQSLDLDAVLKRRRV